ncbi:uncharacterized protein LOC143228758 [Tachypleus tridentatus]|uniref:uncharacterized protein LOC143228758 n=1 Tax=Tachypleus tridentatus TaxID=6853 RepID=UPI003FCFD930
MTNYTTILPSLLSGKSTNSSMPEIWRSRYPTYRRGHLSKTYYLSPEYKARKAEEFYQSYDVMTGVRIAATLGGLITLFTLFLFYKSKFKVDHSDQQNTNQMSVCGDGAGVIKEGHSTRNNSGDTTSDSGSISLYIAEPPSTCPEQTDIPLTVYVESTSSLRLPSEVYNEKKIPITSDCQVTETCGEVWEPFEHQLTTSLLQDLKPSAGGGSIKLATPLPAQACSEYPTSSDVRKMMLSLPHPYSIRPYEDATEDIDLTEHFPRRASIQTNAEIL